MLAKGTSQMQSKKWAAWFACLCACVCSPLLLWALVLSTGSGCGVLQVKGVCICVGRAAAQAKGRKAEEGKGNATSKVGRARIGPPIPVNLCAAAECVFTSCSWIDMQDEGVSMLHEQGVCICVGGACQGGGKEEGGGCL